MRREWACLDEGGVGRGTPQVESEGEWGYTAIPKSQAQGPLGRSVSPGALA